MSHFELVVEVVLPRRWEGFRCCPLPFARQVLLQTSELRPQRSFVVPWVACLVGTGVAKEGQERRRTVVLHLLPHWLGVEGHLGLTTPFFVLCFVWFAASIPHSVRSFEEGGQGQEHSSTSREGSCPCFEDEEEFRRVLSSSPTNFVRFRSFLFSFVWSLLLLLLLLLLRLRLQSKGKRERRERQGRGREGAFQNEKVWPQTRAYSPFCGRRIFEQKPILNSLLYIR